MATKMKVAEIEGIGRVNAGMLAKAGIDTIAGLLEKGRTREGRKQIVAASGCSDKQVLRWVNMADLFRIDGVGQEYSDLLEAAGVDTVKELRNRVPENLAAAMTKVNEQRKLVRKLPTQAQVSGWIEQAKKLPPAVEH